MGFGSVWILQSTKKFLRVIGILAEHHGMFGKLFIVFQVVEKQYYFKKKFIKLKRYFFILTEIF